MISAADSCRAHLKANTFFVQNISILCMLVARLKMLKWCTRNYNRRKKNNWSFGINYATSSISSSEGTFRSMRKRQQYSSFLVLDFEATCERRKEIKSKEIIEFPCIKINANTLEVEDIFHQYVQPKVNPILTPFCTELTGITQEMVDDQPFFEETFLQFQNWLDRTDCWNSGNNSIFVTSSDADLRDILRKQCRLIDIDIPFVMRHWIDIHKSFCEVTGQSPRGLIGMLRSLKLPHQGRLHSGIDDCHNIATVLKALVDRGFVFEETGNLHFERISGFSRTSYDNLVKSVELIYPSFCT